MSLDEADFEFPVGDDPHDADVLTYWRGVAQRMGRLLLPKDLAGWGGAILARISEFEAARAAITQLYIDASEDAEALAAARSRLRLAEMEFPRLKWKLNMHFVSHFGKDDPGLLALFARGADGPDN